MAAAPPLDQFILEQTEEGYRLTVSAGDQRVSAEVDPDQLDAIIEALEAALGGDDYDDDDDAFEIEEEEEED